MYDLLNFLREEYPYAFYPNIKIASVFGIFDGCVWNGGGMNLGGSVTREVVERYVDIYNNKLHLPLRFTFTNPVLTSELKYDSYANMIAEVAHNGKNEILTSSYELENFLRERYPNYKYCRSIVGTEQLPYYADDKYYLTVMRRAMNNNWEFLDSIPNKYRDKIEFLCNDPCPENCPRIYSHYRDFGRAQVTRSTTCPGIQCTMKEVKGPFVHNYSQSLNTTITYEQIVNDYIPRGFNQFKLSGRTAPLLMANNIAQYMVQPEYRVDVANILLEPYIHTDHVVSTIW